MTVKSFTKLAWTAVAYNMMVIVWGAYVRATGSGAGCGSHWPLCNGEVIPREPQLETLIELSHRITSGIALPLVLVVWWLSRKLFAKGHRVRTAALASVGLVLVEALIGAGLVLFELVADDASTARGVSMPLHLMVTFLLLTALTLTASWPRHGTGAPPPRRQAAGWLLKLCVVAMLLTGATGGISALGDTLFPAESLIEGLQQDVDPSSHWLVRLRTLHPAFAIGTGLVLLVFARRQVMPPYPEDEPTSHRRRRQRLGQALMAMVFVQLAGGVLNLALLAPVPMQLVHLLLADVVWILLILTADAALDSGTVATAPIRRPLPAA